jgi:single-stranded DNA-binding protein
MSKSEMPDSNDITFSGTVITEPSWFQLSANKKALIFTIRSEELFQKADGRQASHSNDMDVEVLGKSAERYFQEIHVSKYCIVKGYIRTDIIDGVKKARIRAYKVSYVGNL